MLPHNNEKKQTGRRFRTMNYTTVAPSYEAPPMSTNYFECQEEVNAAIALYWATVSASWLLTLFNIVIRCVLNDCPCPCCLTEGYRYPFGVVSVVHFLCGIISLILGISVFTFLKPTCPEDCDVYCYHHGRGDDYGTVEFFQWLACLLGLFWMYEAYENWKRIGQESINCGAASDLEYRTEMTLW